MQASGGTVEEEAASRPLGEEREFDGLVDGMRRPQRDHLLLAWRLEV